jgi:hypothetical protein
MGQRRPLNEEPERTRRRAALSALRTAGRSVYACLHLIMSAP